MSGVYRMNYKEAMTYMENVQKRGILPGLDSIKMLLDRLDHPQDKLNIIHVAGTNGKGSICTFLEAMYRREGKKTGRYISPVLHCYLERFQVNGKYMEENVFARLLSEVVSVLEEMEREGYALPTAFEMETVISFLYFLEEGVDIVLLETGMGGREDATNVAVKPLCTVFSSIGMDHMQFLGSTLEEITYEKAGIIKDGCPAVTYPNSEKVTEILKGEADLHHALLRVVKKEDVQILSETLSGSRFLYKGEEYRIHMLGKHQIYNAVTAIETKLLLDGHLMKESLAGAAWEGRFEKLSDTPLLIRDGAHNVDGVLALKESMQKHFTNTRFLFIIGVLKDKEYDKMMEILCPLADKIFTVTPENIRGLPGEVLRDHILPYCKDVTVCRSVEEAVSRAEQEWMRYEAGKRNAAIIAWGSLSYIGKIHAPQ